MSTHLGHTLVSFEGVGSCHQLEHGETEKIEREGPLRSWKTSFLLAF